MKKVLSLLTLVGVIGLFPMPAQADTPGCVTRPEFRRMELGMRQARVRVIFDAHGQQIEEHNASETFAYDTCSNRGVVFVTYRHNRVIPGFSWVRGE